MFAGKTIAGWCVNSAGIMEIETDTANKELKPVVSLHLNMLPAADYPLIRHRRRNLLDIDCLRDAIRRTTFATLLMTAVRFFPVSCLSWRKPFRAVATM